MSPDSQAPPNPQLNPQAMALGDVSRLLARLASQPITAQMLSADIAAGAPTNSDGTISLVHYAAWLVRELKHCE